MERGIPHMRGAKIRAGGYARFELLKGELVKIKSVEIHNFRGI